MEMYIYNGFTLKHGRIGLINNGKAHFHYKGGVVENVVGILNKGEMILELVDVTKNTNGIINNGTIDSLSYIAWNANSGVINNGNLVIKFYSNVDNNGKGVINNGNLTINDYSTISINKEDGVINYGNFSMDCYSVISGNGNNGISNYGSLTLTDSSILDNGNSGLYSNSSAKIIYSKIQSNNNIGINNEGTLTLTDSLIEYNNITSGWGAGGIMNLGTLHIINCHMQHNDGLEGGAIYNDNILTITDSIISHNEGGEIGSIYNNDNGILNITNSKIHANRECLGGGISNSGLMSVVNCEITEANLVDIYYSSDGYLVQSADLYGTLIRETDFFVSSGTNLFDDVDSPLRNSGTWTKNIGDRENNYVFLYDHDGHYSKLKIVNWGGGNPGDPAWVEVQWYYNSALQDNRF